MDKKLFENLFRSYYSVLCRYALRYLHDEQVAEDIVQEYYVDIWENAKLSIIPEQFFSYSCHAIYNRCLNYYKAEATKEAFINRLSVISCSCGVSPSVKATFHSSSTSTMS